MKRAAIIAGFVLHNNRIRMRHLLARSDAYSGSMSLSPQQVASHAQGVFHNYCSRASLQPSQLAGKRILELGPGDNVAVAMLFAAAGAVHVTTLDKFRYNYETPHHDAVLQALGVESSLRSRIRALCSLELHEADHHIEPESFDLVVSNAVLEELPEPDAAFTAIHRALRRGGSMLHQVDLSDYGMFTSRGFPPQEFLTISDSLYSAMTKHSGGPNRRLPDYYRHQLCTYEYSLSVTHTYGDDMASSQSVEKIRPRLLPRYQTLSARDLLTHGIFLNARKP